MYTLKVYRPDEQHATTSVHVKTGEGVLKLIPELLATYGDCECVSVMFESTHLFSVDCHGNRIAARDLRPR